MIDFIHNIKRLLIGDDLISNGGMWQEEIYDYDEEGYEFADIIYDLTRPYVVAEVEAGSDAGQYVILDREEIKKLL